jgi:hypothetical protein
MELEHSLADIDLDAWSIQDTRLFRERERNTDYRMDFLFLSLGGLHIRLFLNEVQV